MKIFNKKIELKMIIPILLFFFMLLIFGPSEIYYSNREEFAFLFKDYILWGLLIFVLTTLFFSLFQYIKIVDKLEVVFFFSLDVLTYIQVMFFNKDLDLIGAAPQCGYIAPYKKYVSLAIYLVFMIVNLILIFRWTYYKKIVVVVSSFLFLIQLVAIVTFIPAIIKTDNNKEMDRIEDNVYYFDGTDQMVVSGNNNIIVFVLDYYAADYFDGAAGYYYDYLLKYYPEMTEGLKDFVYYNNEDCVYMGTFPSMVHMFTGMDVNPNISINEWTKAAWTSEPVNEFYSELHDLNYKVNFFTDADDLLFAANGFDLLQGKFDNISNETRELSVDYKGLVQVMIKTSAFRMSPHFLKRRLYVKYGEYSGIIYSERDCAHYNYKFNELMDRAGKLTVDNSSNYFIIQHINGIHSYEIDQYGDYSTEGTRLITEQGVIYIVEKYLDMLKEAGVYDDATIIITADHGAPEQAGTIFFLKMPGQEYDSMQYNNAPISHCELFPTLAWFINPEICEKYEMSTIFDFSEDEERIRWHYRHQYDDNYPDVPRFNDEKLNAGSNVFYGWQYTGSRAVIEERMESELPDVILPMVDYR